MLLHVLITFLLNFSVEAAHLDTICESAISYPPIFSNGLVARKTSDNRFLLESLQGEIIYEHDSRILSVVENGEKIWLLSSEEILELDSKGSLLGAYPLPMNKSMTMAGRLLLVVRSGGVISAFDTDTKETKWTTYMQDVPGGRAVSITFDGKFAYVAMATSRENGFTGVVTLDPVTGEVLKKTPYDTSRVGVIAPLAYIRFHKDKLILNNLGWIHVLNLKQVSSGKPVRPKWIAHEMARDTDPHYMMLQGDFFFEENKLVGCGSYRELIGSERIQKSALFKVVLP